MRALFGVPTPIFILVVYGLCPSM
ncbi:noelin-3a isoform X1, partial [Tachysurus ichikawai]